AKTLDGGAWRDLFYRRKERRNPLEHGARLVASILVNESSGLWMARGVGISRAVRLRQGGHEHLKAVLRDEVPYIAVERAPQNGTPKPGPASVIDVATYNVHRWTGLTGGRRWMPELALEVIREMDADVMAIQEALRPFGARDPLMQIADELGYYLTFVSTRVHRVGELGNAILSRWPMSSVYTIDLSLSRLERRSAAVALFDGSSSPVAVASTHLALVDRTRKRQVQSLLESENLQGPAILLGDMNAWRRCPATRTLDETFRSMHHNLDWPATFPSTRPVLALDRIYTRGAH